MKVKLIKLFVFAAFVLLVVNIFLFNKVGLLDFKQLTNVSNKKQSSITKQPQLQFMSDLGNYQINKKNIDILERYLEELEFFKEEKVVIINKKEQTRTNVTVRNLIIHLTDESYPNNRFALEDGEYLRSTKTEFSEGQLDLYIGMNKDYYLKELDERTNANFSVQVIGAIYDLVNPEELHSQERVSYETSPKTIKKYVEEMKTKGNIVNITKKINE